MSEIGDLIEAADLHPGKGALMRAVLRAANDAVDPEEAYEWLGRVDPKPYDAGTQISVAEFLIESDEADTALRWTEGEEARICVARAR